MIRCLDVYSKISDQNLEIITVNKNIVMLLICVFLFGKIFILVVYRELLKCDENQRASTSFISLRHDWASVLLEIDMLATMVIEELS